VKPETTTALTNNHQNGEAFKTGSSLTELSIESKATLNSFPLRYSQNQRPAIETPCSPDSQISNTLPTVANEATEMAVLKENYQQPAKVNKDNSTVAADSQVANCFRLGYQQVIHITSTVQTLESI